MVASSPERLFEDSPAGLRRLVLLLYALVLPPFLGVLAMQLPPGDRWGAVGPIAAICGAAASWVALRRSPRTLDWIYPVGIAPTLSCGLAFAATGGHVVGYMAVVTAPLAWAAVLCDAPVVVAAWLTGVLTMLIPAGSRDGWGEGTADALLYAIIPGLVAWVVHGKTARYREARLRSLERQLNDIELLARADGAIVDANDRAVEGYRCSREALLRLRMHDLGRESERALVEAQLMAVERAGGAVFEAEHLRSDGSHFPVEVSARAYRIRGRRYVHSVVRDISARRAAEAQQRFLATLFENLNEAVVVLDEAFRIQVWSPGAERIFGWTEEEVMGRSPFGLLVPREAEATTARAITAAAAGRRSTELVRWCRKDGRELAASLNLVALQDGSGAITGVMAVARDVTEQQAAQVALRESEERLSLALLAADTEIWEWEPERGAVRVGSQGASLLGVQMGEVTAAAGSGLRALVHPDDRALVDAAVLDHLEGRAEAVVAEARVPLADGSIRWAHLRGRVMGWTEAGAPSRILGTVRDVTTRRQAEEERKRLLAEANRATEAREQVLAVVAHDLRSPLAAIASTASEVRELGREPGAPPELSECADLIRSAAARMGRLIDDLLDVAAIQKGSLRLAPERSDCAALVEDAVRAAEPLVRSSRLRLSLEVAAVAPEACCDRGRILQVLGNLLANACHATPPGGTVTLRLAEDGGALHFTVRDTGRGFEEGAAERLFQPYQRGAASFHKGAGLGLAIARGIVEGHGGRIWAERATEGGAAFHFLLPVGEVAAPRDPPGKVSAASV
ncbi:MAG TPA: PAS domain S-box protein [Anaeromyxobacter sp.]|nr:PAS domain S-box protein [Anaeromyxobacter sp.]